MDELPNFGILEELAFQSVQNELMGGRCDIGKLSHCVPYMKPILVDE